MSYNLYEAVDDNIDSIRSSLYAASDDLSGVASLLGPPTPELQRIYKRSKDKLQPPEPLTAQERDRLRERMKEVRRDCEAVVRELERVEAELG
jgi:hypothetical protein